MKMENGMAKCQCPKCGETWEEPMEASEESQQEEMMEEQEPEEMPAPTSEYEADRMKKESQGKEWEEADQEFLSRLQGKAPTPKKKPAVTIVIGAPKR
jgi:hypothetical protein